MYALKLRLLSHVIYSSARAKTAPGREEAAACGRVVLTSGTNLLVNYGTESVPCGAVRLLQNRDRMFYNSGTPVCLDCAKRLRAERKPPAGRDILAVLQGELQQATERAHQATDAFHEIMGDIPEELHCLTPMAPSASITHTAGCPSPRGRDDAGFIPAWAIILTRGSCPTEDLD